MAIRGNVPCTIDGCDHMIECRGWCQMHYQRWKKYGDPLTLRQPKGLPVIDRFMQYVRKTSTCWMWAGSISKRGYGRFWDGQSPSNAQVFTGAHRFSYEYFCGPIPVGMQIDHICRNPSCVRPDHLRLATPKENVEHHSGKPMGTNLVRGVSYEKARQRYRPRVRHHGKLCYGPDCQTIEEAEQVVIALRNQLFTRNGIDRTTA